MMMDALKLQYEAEIEKAKANIQVYLSNPVGIGEHPDLVSAINSQIEVIANAEDRLAVILKYYGASLKEKIKDDDGGPIFGKRYESPNKKRPTKRHRESCERKMAITGRKKIGIIAKKRTGTLGSQPKSRIICIGNPIFFYIFFSLCKRKPMLTGSKKMIFTILT